MDVMEARIAPRSCQVRPARRDSNFDYYDILALSDVRREMVVVNSFISGAAGPLMQTRLLRRISDQ